MNEIIGRYKKTVPLTEIITFADDLVITGDFEWEKLDKIFKKYRLKLNKKNCRTLRIKIKGIPKRKIMN